MTPSCRQIRGRFDDYSAEALTREQRRAVREHLASCEECRRVAAAADPLFLFAGAAEPPVPPAEISRILEGVRSGIAWKQAERRVEAPSRRRRWSILGAAAAALLLTLLAPGAPPRRDAPAAVAGPRQSADTGFAPAAIAPPQAPGVTSGTQKFPADATIYDFNPGAGQPRVVWIVDRSIDI